LQRIDPFVDTLRIAERAEELSRQANARVPLEDALYVQGTLHMNLGNYTKARRCLERAQPIGGHRSARSTLRLQAPIANELGELEFRVGNYSVAREQFQQSLTVKHKIGLGGEMSSLRGLATVELRLGNYGEARARFEQALTVARAICDRAGEAASLYGLGGAELELGHYVEARDRVQRALTIYREIGDRGSEAACWHHSAGSSFNSTTPPLRLTDLSMRLPSRANSVNAPANGTACTCSARSSEGSGTIARRATGSRRRWPSRGRSVTATERRSARIGSGWSN
jgi:tetratricopeptide (TPR) repeat protein